MAKPDRACRTNPVHGGYRRQADRALRRSGLAVRTLLWRKCPAPCRTFAPRADPRICPPGTGLYAGPQSRRTAGGFDAQALFTIYLVRVEFGEPHPIGLMIDFWSGAGAYARIPMRQKHSLNELAATNAEDVRASFSETVIAPELTAFDRPLIIAVGSASPPMAGLISHALARFLPQADVGRSGRPCSTLLPVSSGSSAEARFPQASVRT